MSFRPYDNLPQQQVKRHLDFSESPPKSKVNVNHLLSRVTQVEDGLFSKEAQVDTKLAELKDKVSYFLSLTCLVGCHWKGD